MYDVIIVGARVAGAPTAMLLARRGLKVLVVDRATFPSDTLSTHQVQLPGVARLARWGVLDAVLAAGTPVTRDVRFDQGDAVITGRYPGLPGRRRHVQPAPHAARPGAGGRGPGGRRRGQGELHGRRAPRRRPGHRHPRPGEGRARRHRAGARWSSARTASTRWWPRRSAPAPTAPRRRGRSPSTPTGRACWPGTAAGGEMYGRPGLRRRCLADQRRAADDLPGLADRPVRRVPPRRRGQLPAHARRRRPGRADPGRPAGPSASAAPPTCPATCASPTVPAGPWSVTPAC